MEELIKIVIILQGFWIPFDLNSARKGWYNISFGHIRILLHLIMAVVLVVMGGKIFIGYLLISILDIFTNKINEVFDDGKGSIQFAKYRTPQWLRFKNGIEFDIEVICNLFKEGRKAIHMNFLTIAMGRNVKWTYIFSFCDIGMEFGKMMVLVVTLILLNI